MPQYRRDRIPSSIIFITCVTYERQPLFSIDNAVNFLRYAVAQTQKERPFEIVSVESIESEMFGSTVFGNEVCATPKKLISISIIFITTR